MTINQAIQHILSEYGRSILAEHKRVEALLRDLCPEENQRRDVNLAVLALKEGVPRELIAMNAPAEVVVGQLVKRLEDALYLSESVAKLSINTWAEALNITLPKIAIQNSVSQTPPPQIITAVPNVSKPTQPISELDQGVWTDPKTGLMWARINIGQEWLNGECVGDAKGLNWHDAQKACQDNRLAGYSDWRLPSSYELKSILDPLAVYNCPKNTLFQPENEKNVYTTFYHWSDIQAYGVYFGSNHNIIVLECREAFGRAVRNSVLDEGVWNDQKTGLMWSRVSIGQEYKSGRCLGDASFMTWDQANQACANSCLADYQDWRLPDLKELKSLMIPFESGYAAEPIALFQPRFEIWGSYWSASLHTHSGSIFFNTMGYDDASYWGVNFGHGSTFYSNRSVGFRVRAVRTNI